MPAQGVLSAQQQPVEGGRRQPGTLRGAACITEEVTQLRASTCVQVLACGRAVVGRGQNDRMHLLGEVGVALITIKNKKG